MSANPHQSLKLEDWVLLGAGLIGLALFIFLFPQQHPDAAAIQALGTEQATEQATSFLNQQGFSVTDLNADASYHRDPALLYMLQTTMGRPEAIRHAKVGALEEVPGYYWKVEFWEDDEEGDDGRRIFYTVYLTQEGQAWRFLNERTAPRQLRGATRLDRDAHRRPGVSTPRRR